MFDLYERYNKLRTCVSKAFVDVNMVSNVTAEDMKTLKDICSCLDPLKVSTEALRQNDAKVLSLEATVQFLPKIKLSEITTPYSQTLRSAVSLRISERGNITGNVLRYLHTKQNLSDFTGVKVSKTSLHITAIRLGRRLFLKNTGEGGTCQ